MRGRRPRLPEPARPDGRRHCAGRATCGPSTTTAARCGSGTARGCAAWRCCWPAPGSRCMRCSSRRPRCRAGRSGGAGGGTDRARRGRTTTPGRCSTRRRRRRTGSGSRTCATRSRRRSASTTRSGPPTRARRSSSSPPSWPPRPVSADGTARAASNAERARVSVTKAIRTTHQAGRGARSGGCAELRADRPHRHVLCVRARSSPARGVAGRNRIDSGRAGDRCSHR